MSTASRLLSLALCSAGLAVACTGPAAAWVSYQLGDNYYAIRCADGTLHSYSGSSAGLSVVGPALCDGHGGLVAADTGPQILPATSQIRSQLTVPTPTPAPKGVLVRPATRP